jgi:hypothetical protein
MGEKVSQYVETQTEYNDNDLFDVSAYLGVDSYESRKTLFSTLKEAIFPALSDVFTKDANDNVFYKGVGATMGAGCNNNTFYQAVTNIILGTNCFYNIFKPGTEATLGNNCYGNTFEGYTGAGFIFGNNLQNTTIKIGCIAADYTDSPDYDFLYNLVYPSEIFRNAENTANYHRYYDPTNDRIVLTNLTTLAVSYIGVARFIEVTRAALQSLEGAGTLSLNVWYKVTDAIGNTAKILVSATSVSIVSKAAVNLTEGNFGSYTLNSDTYVAQGNASSTWTVVSTNQTAVNDGQYTVIANSTFTDPTGVNGKGYWVVIRSGTATIGGNNYSQSGTIIYRLFLSGVWGTYTQSAFNDATSSIQTQINAKQDALTAANMHTYVDSLTALTTPVDSDRMIIVDNSASLAKKITWANIKATLKTYFDAIYQTILVSGTNIKTINSTSVLGSGNIAVEPTITAGTTSQYYRGDKTFQTLDKTAVGLANVDNTSDANKPISTATQTALNAKVDTFTMITQIGTWSAPADSTTYYAPIIIGIVIPITTITTFLSAFTFATKIVGIYVQHLNSTGTQGTSENVAIQIRNNTTSTSTQLINIQTNQASGVQKNFEDYSLNIAIAANDSIALQINTPAWATNPTNLVIRITLFFQRT